MLKALLTRFLLVVLMIGTSSAIAQWSPSFALSGGYLVQSIYAGDAGDRVGVSFLDANPPYSPRAPNPSGCTQTYSYVILPTNTRKKELLHMFHLAFALGRPVNIYLSGCVVNSAATLPVIADAFIF